MHELSIAQALADSILEQIDRHGVSRVVGVRLRIGQLRGVVADCVTFYLDTLLENTAAEGARIEVEEVPVRLYCAACDLEAEAPAIWALSCPQCHGPAEIRAGKELTLVSLEAE